MKKNTLAISILFTNFLASCGGTELEELGTLAPTFTLASKAANNLETFVKKRFHLSSIGYAVDNSMNRYIGKGDIAYIHQFMSRAQHSKRVPFSKSDVYFSAFISSKKDPNRKDIEYSSLRLSLMIGPKHLPSVKGPAILKQERIEYSCAPKVTYSSFFNCKERAGMALVRAVQKMGRL
jgi:hypothetical protein